MILTARTPSFNSYLENPDLVLAVLPTCPACGTRVLSRHGAVSRRVYFVGERLEIVVFRLRCRPCRITATLLPDFLLPHLRYAAAVVAAAVDEYLGGGGSCRRVAMAITGTVVPENLAGESATDAIEVLRLKPGYQRVHAWVARVAAAAVADVHAAAAWVVARVPTSTVVDHLTTPLDPQTAGRTRDDTKRAGLDAARMLARIFTTPELDPAGAGWLAAWVRFVAVVARPPRRAPPRSPPEPRSS